MTFNRCILIVGAGIGGLSLAQGLKKAGIPFRVFERDPSPDFRAQGYRLRINHYGATALKSTLTDDLWRLFENTCADTQLGMTGLNAIDGTVTRVVPGAGGDPSIKQPVDEPLLGPFTADRKTLRDLLLIGLENEVEFGKTFERFEIHGEQQVTAFFKDGTQAQGSLLIGADGIQSRVRRQHLPQLELVDSTGRCIYGKTPITPELTKSFPAEAMRWITAIKDPRPLTLFLEPVRFSSNVEQVSDGRLSSVPDYVYWVLAACQSIFNVSDDELLSMSSREAADLSLRLTEDWDPRIRSLLVLQSQDKASALRLMSTAPSMQNWETLSAITFLGDSIHPMPPAGGSGANTALRDSANLLEAIKQGATKAQIEEYENALRAYAGEAIAGSWHGGKSLFNLPSYEDCKR
ncbi:FAD/NAD(P)-binding domain-containing protein [Basidiobolus meristosporus CBS 931.73]|uniref:FAD/NAD(P)-binding domain-containing protein n=1 Tax=Basidiobolus meristosporus CBS 931.73 TaxID=1314790 RepID=A0A1Y1YEP5_9FUNG|nr:FAD/NAD(P)-binding domain-containing protein [Basidiobolus meristosporus CBS 931.73]|eukprot:ORX96482.1 FAD/NAD(P)-binding domain-containing protein [Basidiobolus meristosporus CBS 931.73]